LTSPVPADRGATRFRLPVAPPTRNLLMASLASIAGACQLFAWALARLPTFFLIFGATLIGIALALALSSWVRYQRLRWVAYVGPDSLSVLTGRRRESVSWDKVRGVRYQNFQLEIHRTDASRELTLPVDRTRAADEGAGEVLRAMQTRLAARP
jgi:hypothetical protein